MQPASPFLTHQEIKKSWIEHKTLALSCGFDAYFVRRWEVVRDLLREMLAKRMMREAGCSEFGACQKVQLGACLL
jgi:hypothetical protein